MLAAVFALGVGCGGAGGDAARTEAGGSAEREASGAVPASGSEDDGVPVAGDADGGFVASAEGSGGEAGAADRIEGVRFQIFDGHERLLIDFGRDGGGAGIPLWSVESPEQGGYVRLRFPGIASTTTGHEDLIGDVLSEVYVVRDGGGLFADVFAMHEFRYRIVERPEAGQLAVDFRGVPEEMDFPPTTGDRAVVLQPREAEEVESPIDVRGYARPPEGEVTVSLLDREQDLVASKTVRADAGASAWGLFEASLEFSGHEGIATIRVGPEGGSFFGTETEVFLESSGPG